MAEEALTTTVHDVLDPIAGERCSIRWRGGRLAETGPSLGADGGREIDGSALWLLPALYDADAHMPHVPFGVRISDLHRALAGGVAHMNVALPWQLARGLDLRRLVADVTRFALPKLTLLLSVSPAGDSEEFPAWLSRHAPRVKELMPATVKLYSMDPRFDANLDAVLEAGLMPMVWNDTDEALAKVTACVKGPMHLRHATSAAMVEQMETAPQATLQTSPHFLLPLADGRREALTVLPTPPGAEDRQSLASVCLEHIDVIASDHVAPAVGDPTGPGLQTQQHFLPALLTLCGLYGWPLDRVLEKATRAPAKIFGFDPPAGFALVDPTPGREVERWPRQTPDRAPFLGLSLEGRVLAVAAGGRVELV